jgi:hypothetical protein
LCMVRLASLVVADKADGLALSQQVERSDERVESAAEQANGVDRI